MSRWKGASVGVALVFVVLAVATAVASFELIGVNRDAYHDWINPDPQGDAQQSFDVRMSAALMYTSGHSVGQLSAALFGVVLGATAGGRVRLVRLAVAVVGGAGLAAVSLALALPRARTAVGRLSMIDELTRHGFSFDPNLLHDTGVLAFLVAGLLLFPLWAVIGLGAGQLLRPVIPAALALAYYPVCLVVGFLTGGLPNLVLPFYSNLGTAQLVLRSPTTAIVITLVSALWATASCLAGFARARRV